MKSPSLFSRDPLVPTRSGCFLFLQCPFFSCFHLPTPIFRGLWSSVNSPKKWQLLCSQPSDKNKSVSSKRCDKSAYSAAPAFFSLDPSGHSAQQDLPVERVQPLLLWSRAPQPGSLSSAGWCLGPRLPPSLSTPLLGTGFFRVSLQSQIPGFFPTEFFPTVWYLEKRSPACYREKEGMCPHF